MIDKAECSEWVLGQSSNGEAGRGGQSQQGTLRGSACDRNKVKGIGGITGTTRGANI